MEICGLRKLTRSGVFVPRDLTAPEAKVIDLNKGAFIVPLDYGYDCRQFERDLRELFLRYEFISSLDSKIPEI